MVISAKRESRRITLYCRQFLTQPSQVGASYPRHAYRPDAGQSVRAICGGALGLRQRRIRQLRDSPQRFFGSASGGLQCNLDSVSSFHDLIKNPELKDYPKEQPTREWAVGLMKLATEKFGENNFPDGRGINFIIEDNVMNENGRVGGGSLNLAGLQILSFRTILFTTISITVLLSGMIRIPTIRPTLTRARNRPIR